jgi:hypothetical protein
MLLRLRPDVDVVHDPLTDRWVTRVRWAESDALRQDFSFTTTCPSGPLRDVSMFHGNLLRVHEGRPAVTRFFEPGTELPPDLAGITNRHYERWMLFGERRGVRCALPNAPLAYLPTPLGGEVAPRSTLHVEVEIGGVRDPWDEVATLVHSDDSAEEGDHFVVETDEHLQSVLRFGDGENGRWLPAGAVVHCEYQVGGGVPGNVGADTIGGGGDAADPTAPKHFRPLALQPPGTIVGVWNPFDVTDGRDPEPVERILRNAPEAYAVRQLRAVTLADYVRRAEEVPGVSRAVARYAWTGSWRTVRIVIDPAGTIVLEPALRDAVAAHLEAVRLIGEDLELRPPRFAPLDIDVTICLNEDFWPEDVRWELEQELSDGYTVDGRRGMFHPDDWTFGQALHAAQIAGRVHRVAGVEHIIEIRMRRFGTPVPAATVPPAAVLEVAFDEIVLAQNDPDHQERGVVRFHLTGGRQ